MDPQAVDNLLLNLKLQLLALPSQAKWGLLAFAGILVLREAITLAWNLHQRRKLESAASEPRAAIPTADGSRKTDPDELGLPALPAPDPLAAPLFPQGELDDVRVRTPPSGLGGR